MGLAVGGDLLDLYRRRDFIDDEMTRIDDLNAFPGHEPQFAIGGLRDTRTVFAGRTGAEPDAIRCIPDGRRNPALRVGDPRIYFGPRDAHQAAAHVQPQRTFVVFYGPIRSVAGQTIPARERCDTTILNPAQAAILRCGPHRPIPIALKMLDGGSPQAISGCVRGAALAILEIPNASVDPESEPHSALLSE